jgi:hypothetical protein
MNIQLPINEYLKYIRYFYEIVKKIDPEYINNDDKIIIIMLYNLLGINYKDYTIADILGACRKILGDNTSESS